MPQQYEYEFSLAAPGAEDVASRELHVVRDGVDEAVTLDGAAVSATAVLDENSNVSVYLVDIDDAGNRSASSPSLDFQVTDQVPPPAPGAPGVSRISAI